MERELTPEVVVRQIERYIYEGDDNAISVEAGEMAIEALKSMRVGHWIRGGFGIKDRCSVCLCYVSGSTLLYSHCPCCGALMKEEVTE